MHGLDLDNSPIMLVVSAPSTVTERDSPAGKFGVQTRTASIFRALIFLVPPLVISRKAMPLAAIWHVIQHEDSPFNGLLTF
mmetsp:Transcript_39990/g.97129  ORF Transcript_39990/g.97129 Transcript_39990/m.97129 type:complete len:81 (-) Transcript_39990:507-749(-)